MITNKPDDYMHETDWLDQLLMDEIWLNKLEELEKASFFERGVLRTKAIRWLGHDIVADLYEIHNGDVRKVVQDMWEDDDYPLLQLKVRTIGMLVLEWLDQHRPEND